MAGRKTVVTPITRQIDQRAEFQDPIAQNAGIRRSAGQVFPGPMADDATEDRFGVEEKKGDLERLRHAEGVGGVARQGESVGGPEDRARPGFLSGGVKGDVFRGGRPAPEAFALVPIEGRLKRMPHKDGSRRCAFFSEQIRRRRTVDAPGKGNQRF